MKPILLTLLFALLPLSAHAQDAQRSIHVRYADLDLSTPAGIEMLDHRLAWAVFAICAETPGSAGMGQRLANWHCVQAKTAEIAPLRERAIAARARPVMLAARTR
jgi:UrcA family protein